VLNLEPAGNYSVTGIEPEIATGKSNNGVITVKGYKSKTYSTNTYDSAKPYVLVEGDGGNEVVALVDGKPLTGTAISHLNEKLVIIDGKESTAGDLKKLSAFDIERINFKNDDYTRHQYGDRAKKGVVYIYTKKTKQ
jgi:hypothetical protein